VIAKFSPWSPEIYHKSEHPEVVAIRNIISRNSQNNFVLIGVGGQKCEYFKEKGISFYNFGSNTRFKYLLSFFLRFFLCFPLRPTVIVSMGTIDLIPFGIASILTRTKFIPIITGEIWFDLSQVAKPFRKIFAFLLNASLLKAHAVLAISESVGKEVENSYRIKSEKVFVYKYKISSTFNPDVPRTLKQILNPNGKTVLTICRISPQKGLEYLVEACQIIIREIPNVKVVIKAYSSDERYEERLRSIINKYHLQEFIKILKLNVPYSEMPKYMAAADVFVLPSVSEGLGIVILEALATGIPVVASRIGGIPDVLVHEYNGLLVEPRDVEGLAEALLRILRDDKLKKQLIEGGLSTIQRMKENEIEKLLGKIIFKESKVT